MCHIACHAAQATSGVIRSQPLADALQALHDVLLAALRQLVKESHTKPELALTLTNAFITLGGQEFLDALLNGKEYSHERALLLSATRLLLVRFKHPEVLEPPPRPCASPGCSGTVVFDDLCARHAAAKYRAAFAKPTLRAFLREPSHFAAFNKWLVQRATAGSSPGSTATLPSNVHPRLLAFHRAVVGYRGVCSRQLRLVRARVILDKYLSPAGAAYVSLGIAPDDLTHAIAAAVCRGEGLDTPPSLPEPAAPPLTPPSTASTPSTASAGVGLGSGSGPVPALALGDMAGGGGGLGPLTARLGPGAVSSSLFDSVHERALDELRCVFDSEYVGSDAFTSLVAGVSAAVLSSGRTGTGAGLALVAEQGALAGMLWTADLQAAAEAQAVLLDTQEQETARETGVAREAPPRQRGGGVLGWLRGGGGAAAQAKK